MDRSIEAGRSAQSVGAQNRRAAVLGDTGAGNVRAIEFVRDARLVDGAKVVRFQQRARSETVDRVVNLTLALLATIAVAPVLMLVALAVKLTSPGPVFYSQTRVGTRAEHSPAGRRTARSRLERPQVKAQRRSGQ